MNVTILDIARACKMDVSTVSRALHGSPRVKKSTQEKIRAKAAELHYSPNRNARALASGRTGNFWLLLPTLFNVIEQQEAMALSKHVYDAGLDLMLVLYHGDVKVYDRLLNQLSMKAADGAFILPPSSKLGQLASLKYLIDIKFPLVFIDRKPFQPDEVPVTLVTSDNWSGAVNLTHALIDYGISRIESKFCEVNSVELERAAGFRSVEVKQSPDKNIGYLASSYSAISQLEKEDKLQRGSVIGLFDEWQGAASRYSAIFHVRQDFENIAVRALEIMQAKIQDPDAFAGTQIKIPVSKVTRIK